MIFIAHTLFTSTTHNTVQFLQLHFNPTPSSFYALVPSSLYPFQDSISRCVFYGYLLNIVFPIYTMFAKNVCVCVCVLRRPHVFFNHISIQAIFPLCLFYCRLYSACSTIPNLSTFARTLTSHVRFRDNSILLKETWSNHCLGRRSDILVWTCTCLDIYVSSGLG